MVLEADVADFDIVVVGGGIGGLSCAHAVASSNPELRVAVLERLSVLGGQARSEPAKMAAPSCGSEYAWRIWSDAYKNLLSLLGEVPLEEGVPARTVVDAFVGCGPYASFREGKPHGRLVLADRRHWASPLTYLRFLWRLADLFLRCDERLEAADSPFVEALGLSDEASLDAAYEIAGPLLGLEATKATTLAVTRGSEATYGGFLNGGGSAYVTNRPFDEAIFQPWRRFLTGLGVRFFLGDSASEVLVDREGVAPRARGVRCSSGLQLRARAVVLCLGQHHHARLVRDTPGLGQLSPTLARSVGLAGAADNYWFSVRLYLGRPSHEPAWTSATVTDQPWKLVILRVSEVWTEAQRTTCAWPEVWCVSAIDHVSGWNGKRLRECSVAEATAETVRQLVEAGLVEYEQIGAVEPWEGWATEERPLRNTLNEYKMSINPGIRPRQPPASCPEVQGLFVGSVLARNEIAMVSMEIASQNGLAAARAATTFLGVRPSREVLSLPAFSPRLVHPLRAFDRLLYAWGLSAPPLLLAVVLPLTALVVLLMLLRLALKAVRRLGR